MKTYTAEDKVDRNTKEWEIIFIIYKHELHSARNKELMRQYNRTPVDMCIYIYTFTSIDMHI